MSETLTRGTQPTETTPQAAEGAAIVDALAVIFTGQIAPNALAVPQQAAVQNPVAQAQPEGALSRTAIKAALASAELGVPTVDKAYPKVVSSFADRRLRYENHRAGVSSMLAGGDPGAKPVDINLEFESLQTQRAELERDIAVAVDAEDKLRAKLAAEPGANQVLDGRIKALGGAGFGVGYLEAALKLAQPPKDAPEDGIDARDEGRAKLATDLGVAETFKTHLPALASADTTLATYPQALRDGFAKSRPVLPEAGIAAARDLEVAATAEGVIAPWSNAVTDAGVYKTAVEAFDAEAATAKSDTWPGPVTEALRRVRKRADGLAGEAASKLGPVTPACDVLEMGKTTISAAAKYAVAQQRIDAEMAKFPPKLKLLGDWFATLAASATKHADPSAATFAEGIKDLVQSEAAIPKALDYAKAHDEAETTYTKFKAGLKGPATQPVTKARKEIDEQFKAVLESANGMEYDAALAAVKKVAVQIEAAVVARAGATLQTGTPAHGVHAALAGAKDAEGGDLVAKLYLEFGETDFPKFLAGMTGAMPNSVPNSPDAGLAPDVAGANLKTLGSSIGVKGLKELATVFGGKLNNGDMKGARNLGAVMNAGMTPKQVGEMHGVFAVGDVAGAQATTQLFDTAFSGNPRIFSAIASQGLKTSAQADEALPGDVAPDARKFDKGVLNLKVLADSFAGKTQLKTVVDGVAARDPNAPRVADFEPMNRQERTRTQSKLDAEQAVIAAKRMQNLVLNHGQGDPTKVKTPFFDQINGFPDAEYDNLLAAWRADQAYQNTPPEDRVGPAPVYTPGMDARLDRLHNAGRDNTAKITLIRNASTLKCGWNSPDDPPAEPRGVPLAPNLLAGLRCTAADQVHFEDRHLRSCNPLQPPALALSTTPVGDPQDKTTTLWPEGTTPSQVKAMLQAAIASAGTPIGGNWQRTSFNTRSFNTGPGRVEEQTGYYKCDVRVPHTTAAAGRQITKQFQVRLGVNWVTTTTTAWNPDRRGNYPQTVTNDKQLTQFYPKSGGGLDTVGFEAMQMSKAAAGKRTWPGGGQPP